MGLHFTMDATQRASDEIETTSGKVPMHAQNIAINQMHRQRDPEKNYNLWNQLNC